MIYYFITHIILNPMKQSTNSCNSLKWLLLAAIFTACNTDQIVPSKETAQVVSNQNAKGNVLLRLVKRGATNIQYVKSGKFFGKVSKVTGATYRTEYTYDDNNPGGLLKINSKRYNKLTNALVEEIQYKVSNGFCIGSSNATTLAFSEYYYAQNHLDEIKDYQALGGAPLLENFLTTIPQQQTLTG